MNSIQAAKELLCHLKDIKGEDCRIATELAIERLLSDAINNLENVDKQRKDIYEEIQNVMIEAIDNNRKNIQGYVYVLKRDELHKIINLIKKLSYNHGFKVGVGAP